MFRWGRLPFWEYLLAISFFALHDFPFFFILSTSIGVFSISQCNSILHGCRTVKPQINTTASSVLWALGISRVHPFASCQFPLGNYWSIPAGSSSWGNEEPDHHPVANRHCSSAPSLIRRWTRRIRIRNQNALTSLDRGRGGSHHTSTNNARPWRVKRGPLSSLGSGRGWDATPQWPWTEREGMVVVRGVLRGPGGGEYWGCLSFSSFPLPPLLRLSVLSFVLAEFSLLFLFQTQSSSLITRGAEIRLHRFYYEAAPFFELLFTTHLMEKRRQSTHLDNYGNSTSSHAMTA